MATKDVVTLLRNPHASHETTSPDQGLKPAVAAADWTNFAIKRASVRIAADAAASSANEYSVFFHTNTNGVEIKSATILPDSTVATSASDYALITLGTHPTSGGAQGTAWGTIVTSAGSAWVAYKPVGFTLSNAGAIAASSVVTLKIAKGGSGVAIPACKLVLEYVEN